MRFKNLHKQNPGLINGQKVRKLTLLIEVTALALSSFWTTKNKNKNQS
jgi:hypothetical protein